MFNCIICHKPYEDICVSQKKQLKCCSVDCRKIYSKVNRKRGVRVKLDKDKNCYVCGKLFVTNRANTVCCSDSCKRERIRAMTLEKLIIKKGIR